MSILKEYLRTPNRHTISISNDQRRTYDARKADQNICFCLKCMRCHETIPKKSNTLERTEYYLNFPSLGKPRKTCPRCRSQHDNT
jgi:hypothetical protein